MKFKILSHACLYIESNNHSIVIDPWLIGSCYWRSWWNFPASQFSDEELSHVDAVVISHIHWDHWHGPTLKRYFKDKKVIIPDEPGLRSEKDLRKLGFKDIERVPHGGTVKVGDIAITIYQFGLFLNDAAIVVEANGITLLDANDAKIAGWALQNIIDRHRPIDFALRSHSSANPRICFEIEGDNSFIADDREHYFRSFKAFMDRVSPRYAIPFASNHCHMHEDVYELNSYISNPIELRNYIIRTQQSKNWNLQVMLPGSVWDTETGFQCASEKAFQNLNSELASYRERVKPTLDKQRDFENSIKVADLICDRFLKMLTVAWLPRQCKGKFVVTLKWPDGRQRSLEFDLDNESFTETIIQESAMPGKPVMVFPALVFRDAVMRNMFHHAGISKRCLFLASNRSDMKRLAAIFTALERHELGFYPLSVSYLYRMAKAYIGRWRELFVYGFAIWHLKIRRKPIYLVEEAILRGDF